MLSRRYGRAFVVALVAVICLLSPLVGLGASVEVTVYEKGGGPIMNQLIRLYAVTPDAPVDEETRFFSRPAGWCKTNAGGRCTIDDLPAGIYTPDPWPGVVDRNLYRPPGTSEDVFGTVTLTKPDAKAKVRIELPRGVPVRLRLVAAGRGVQPGTKVKLISDDGEFNKPVVAAFDPAGNATKTLGPGRWIANFDSGTLAALVVEVDLDGREVDTLDVPFELSPPSSDRFITWTLSEPCIVEGKVTSTRTPPGISLSAEVVTPGPWATSAFCQKKSCSSAQNRRPGPAGLYQFDLPCGVWRIAPVGTTLIESTPPFADVDLAEGQPTTANFDIKETEGDGDNVALMVVVQNPEGKPVASAPVALWPHDGDARSSKPLDVQETGRSDGTARFKELAAGRYIVQVRVSGYRVAVERVDEFDPEAHKARVKIITLSLGATIDATALDEKDRPVAGVGLELKRTDTPPVSADPVARLAAQSAEVSVPPSRDQTGHTVVTGLEAGSYEVQPALSERLAASATATIGRTGPKIDEKTTVELAEDGRATLDIRVHPAASFAGRLVCADGGLLPQDVEACVLNTPSPDEDAAKRDACKSTVIPVRMHGLSGDERNQFQIGPLSQGSYRLGLRPRGYAQWTWALGTPDGSGAALLQVEGAAKIELGTLEVLCGPAIELRPVVQSGAPLPGLTMANVEATLTRRSKDGAVETRRPTAELDRDRVMLRELPEGEWNLDVAMSHPFFVPAEPVHLTASVKLERGAMVTAHPVVPDIGGAVVVVGKAGAARLVAALGESRIATGNEGRVSFDGVVPSAYRVELCEDIGCTRITERWSDVRVWVGKRTELALDTKN